MFVRLSLSLKPALTLGLLTLIVAVNLYENRVKLKRNRRFRLVEIKFSDSFR